MGPHCVQTVAPNRFYQISGTNHRLEVLKSAHQHSLISLRTFAPLHDLPASRQHKERRLARLEATAATSVSYATDTTDNLPPYLEIDYDPDRNSAFWSQRPVLVLSRTVQIVAAFSAWFLRSRWHGRTTQAALDADQAARLREILTTLGPAFVKIGQAVSSRPDVAPPSFVLELEKLQDQIPPFPNAQAMAVVAEDLGVPPAAMFSYLSPEPVAAASLGQVYRGRLRDGGRDVAVKVQRPGVRESIALDIHILRAGAGLFGRWRRLNSDLPGLLDEWAQSLFKELDYRKEAANGIRFRELYGDLEGVYVPEMLLEHTRQRVLVMEWVEGRRLRRAGQNGQGPSYEELQEDLKLVEVGVQCSLEQILEVGFHHADPHPGNLLRLPGNRLAYIDFGMMGNIDNNIRRGLIRATLHMVNREFEALAEDFVTLGLLPSGADRQQVVPALTGVFSKALAGGVSNVSFSTLSADLGQTMYQFKFAIPQYYTLLVRSLSVLEGIALSADPTYKVLASAYPWIARRLLSDKSTDLQDTLRALLYKQNKFQFSRLESLLRQAVKSPPRGQVASGTRADITVSPGTRALELLLAESSAYMRDILTEELAKGLDAYWRLSTDDALDAVRARLTSALGVEGQPEAAVGRRERAGTPSGGGALLGALLRVPDLATPEDREQLAGITSLAALLQELSAAASIGGGAAAAQPPRLAVPDFLRPLLPAQAAEVAALLQWLAAELPQLPEAERAEALRLPLQLGAKVSSRITARALRALLAPPAPPAVLAEAERERAPLKSTPTLTAPPLTTRSPVSRTTSPSPESEAVRTAAERRSASGDFFAAPTAGGPPPAAAAAPAPPPKTLSAALPAAVGLPGSRQASAPGNASPPSPGSAAPAAATVVAPVAQVPKVLRPVRGEDRYIVASRNGSGAPAVVPYPGNGKVAGNGKVQL